MKTLLRAACAALVISSVAAPALAADSPWNGTWKLNEAKSNFTGNTFTYSMNPNGTLHYSNGSNVSFNFACDGKDYPSVADRTISCTKADGATYDFTYKAAGKVLGTSVTVISSDGKSITDTYKATKPDGTSFTTTTTSARVSGTAGLAGEWKDTKSASTSASIMTIAVTGDSFHFAYPEWKQGATVKLDGTYAPFTGAQVPEGVTVSYKAVSPTQLNGGTKLNGKLWSEDTMTLSADGKTITDVSWSPGKPNEKTTAVYDKQ